MFHHRIHDKVGYKTYLDWCLLAFLGGHVNAGGYLACHRFVSHVTGFATLAGVSLEKRDWVEAVGTASIPLYFLLGAMTAAYFTEKHLASRIHGERFAPVMTIEAALLGLVAVGGSRGWFGGFGAEPNIGNHFIVLACLTGACGLQNAAITSASGSTVRTTHMTGLTTDLGLGLIRAEVHPMSDAHRRSERVANFARIGTLLSFMTGSLIAAFFFARWQYRAFYVPMGIAVYAAWIARRSEAKLLTAVVGKASAE